VNLRSYSVSLKGEDRAFHSRNESYRDAGVQVNLGHCLRVFRHSFQYVGNDVFMKYMRMDLHDKRFRSKAFSASGLSPNNLAFSNMKDSSFCVVTIATQSPRERRG
jgi:hypothetical protein